MASPFRNEITDYEQGAHAAGGKHAEQENKPNARFNRSEQPSAQQQQSATSRKFWDELHKDAGMTYSREAITSGADYRSHSSAGHQVKADAKQSSPIRSPQIGSQNQESARVGATALRHERQSMAPEVPTNGAAVQHAAPVLEHAAPQSAEQQLPKQAPQNWLQQVGNQISNEIHNAGQAVREFAAEKQQQATHAFADVQHAVSQQGEMHFENTAERHAAAAPQQQPVGNRASESAREITGSLQQRDRVLTAPQITEGKSVSVEQKQPAVKAEQTTIKAEPHQANSNESAQAKATPKAEAAAFKNESAAIESVNGKNHTLANTVKHDAPIVSVKHESATEQNPAPSRTDRSAIKNSDAHQAIGNSTGTRLTVGDAHTTTLGSSSAHTTRTDTHATTNVSTTKHEIDLHTGDRIADTHGASAQPTKHEIDLHTGDRIADRHVSSQPETNTKGETFTLKPQTAGESVRVFIQDKVRSFSTIADNMMENLKVRMAAPEVKAVVEKNPYTVFENLKNAEVKTCVVKFMDMVQNKMLPTNLTVGMSKIVKLAGELGADKFDAVKKRIKETPNGQAPKFHDFDSKSKFVVSTIVRLIVKELTGKTERRAVVQKQDAKKQKNDAAEWLTQQLIKRMAQTPNRQPVRIELAHTVPAAKTNNKAKEPEVVVKDRTVVSRGDSKPAGDGARTPRLREQTSTVVEQGQTGRVRSTEDEPIKVLEPRVSNICKHCGSVNGEIATACTTCKKSIIKKTVGKNCRTAKADRPRRFTPPALPKVRKPA